MKDRQGKEFDVFWVNYEGDNNNLYHFTIIPEIQGYITLSINDTLGHIPVSYFPNNYEIREGKLFVWKDSITPLRKDLLLALNNFGVLDSIDIKRELGMLPDNFKDNRMLINDDGLKYMFYSVCKKNIAKYKRIKTKHYIEFFKKNNLNCK